MKNGKTLLSSNKYLRDPKVRKSLMIRHAAASARIEGVRNAKRRAARIAKSSQETG
jgi:hypothetical protein